MSSSPTQRRDTTHNTGRDARRDRFMHEVHNVEDSARISLLHGGQVISKRTRTFWTSFKDFIDNGNVIGLAVGLILGASFTSLVNSLVDDLISPPLGIALGQASLNNLFVVIKDGRNSSSHYLTLEQVFQSFQQEEIIKSKVKCKYCRQKINKNATRCQFCTSWQDTAEPHHVSSTAPLTDADGHMSN
ncbi:hypothetical protein EDD11_001450 [Mortierella claussenii]|nr:hypothetical protein EDD11_001450 [Mortierella claussenii]